MSRVWIAAVLVLLGAARASLAEHTVVTVTGAEQQASSGVFDKGSLTVTINGYSETVGYGQFSTNASLASGIAAKFSQDCNSTVLAHASGATITFSTKDPAVAIGAVVATLSWDGQDFAAASFALNTPTPPLFTPGINCVPSTIVSGQNLTCNVILLAGASSPVTFSIGGSTWTSATPDPAGSAVANAALTEATPGTYTIAYSYPGDANIPPASGTAQVNVTATGSAPAGRGIYSFSIADQYGNSGYAPNSNVTAYTDSVNGSWSLGYDSLNRLTSSSQTAANGSAQWGCWAYDSFGNMQTQGISNQAFSTLVGCQAQPGANTLQSSLNFNTANQISSGTWLDANKNSHTGSPVYDAAGEMTSDLLNNYLYDAQGQLCAVQTGPNSFTGYLYDAEGHRIAKGTLPSLTCDPAQLQITAAYFIGPDGATMTEMDGNGSWVRTEVSGGGQHLATYTPSGIHYPVTDWLGTKRVTVNPNLSLNNGVEESCASLPFGDQQNCTTPIDASPKHFTGKERDSESGNDYFGARYYGSGMGRFMSPDWAAQAEPVPYAKLTEPQSLNLYAYVRNNPLGGVDADGHDESVDGNANSPYSANWNNNLKDRFSEAYASNLVEANPDYVPSSPPAAQPQTLTAKPVKHPTEAPTEVQFHLSQKSKKGGYIVQEVTLTNDTTNKSVSYWEAWYVNKGQKVTAVNLDGAEYDDKFVDPKGTTVNANARFYEGLTLPDTFKVLPKPSPAGILPMTTRDPHLPTDNATAPLIRTWTAP